MKYLILISFFFLIACTKADSNLCENTKTTSELRECYSKSLIKKQEDLEALVTAISAKIKDYLGSNDSDEFIVTHNNWLAWVDKLCANQRKLYGKGSLAGITVIGCKTRFVDSQTILYKSIYIDSLNFE